MNITLPYKPPHIRALDHTVKLLLCAAAIEFLHAFAEILIAQINGGGINWNRLGASALTIALTIGLSTLEKYLRALNQQSEQGTDATQTLGHDER